MDRLHAIPAREVYRQEQGSLLLPWQLLPWLLFPVLLGCNPRPAGSPPALYHSSLLSYRPIQPLGFGDRAVTPAARSGRSSEQEIARRRRQIVENALSRKGSAPPGEDEAGFILRAYRAAGWDLGTEGGGSSESPASRLHRTVLSQAHVRGPEQPAPGDIAFFDHTRDSNGNGRLDDPLSHVALVEKVDRDGTVHLLHFRQGQVRRFLANPAQPHRRRQGSKIINSFLRPPLRGDPPRTPRLAGQMLAGYATLIL